MKKITVFIGSARKGNTYRAVLQFLHNLKTLEDLDYEIVALKNYRLETCRGCLTCFKRGEERCPLRDDRDVLIKKIEESDGVVFASPNYSFHVSATMKMFLDRLGFVLHRPRFFGKTFTSIVSQGIHGGSKIVDYFDLVGVGLGFNTVKGSCVTTLEPLTDRAERKIDTTLAAHARRFHRTLAGPGLPVPGLLRLMLFRLARTSMKLMLDASSRDYTYYSEKGWFESDYYYAVRLGASKRLAGHLFDWIAARMTKSLGKPVVAGCRPGVEALESQVVETKAAG